MASSNVRVRPFSQYTCFPALAASMVIRECQWSGVAIITASISTKERDVPEYIQMDEKNKKAKLIRVPKFSEIPFPTVMEPNLVIEYYSR